MADDGLRLEIDEALASRLRAAAKASGESVETFAMQALLAAVDEDWTVDFARVAEFEATGVGMSAEEFVSEFRAAVEARFGAK